MKVGDKVKVIKGRIGFDTVGDIIEVDEKLNYPYKVKFDIGQGHNHIWMWFAKDELCLHVVNTS